MNNKLEEYTQPCDLPGKNICPSAHLQTTEGSEDFKS